MFRKMRTLRAISRPVITALACGGALTATPISWASDNVAQDTAAAGLKPAVSPIEIEADRFTVYLADEKAIWQGNVVANQGNYTFRTSLLTLHLDQIGDAPDAADGDDSNSSERQRDAFRLSARELKYNLSEGRVTGAGDSELRRGNEVLRADEITYLVMDRVAHGVPTEQGRVSVQFYGNPGQPLLPGSLGRPRRGAE